MRWLPIALLWLVATPASAGPIRVEIQTAATPRDPFVVSVHGHYADFHNGSSRHWKDSPLRAGTRRFIPLGPVNLLLNMGVSVSVQHPEYVTERARSMRTPLLIRPVGFQTFRPRTWKDVLASGVVIENGGPNYLLGQIVGHFQMFLGTWLPAIDGAAGELAANEARLGSYLPLFDELADLAMTGVAARQDRGFSHRDPEAAAAFERSIAARDAEQRVQVREFVYRIREWLSISREQRVAVREIMESTRYGRRVTGELMRADDLARIGRLVDRHDEDVAARREPEVFASWTNPETRVGYRVRLLTATRRCAKLRITTDLTEIVDADLGQMTRQVQAELCRSGSGEWGSEAS
jgi:hypothetical protein